MEILGLLLAAALGGAINAVAGGGTLVTFPTLLAFGTPSIIANATSTLALVIGTSGSIYGFRRHLAPIKPRLSRFVPVSILGGALGAMLLKLTSERMFSKLVPFHPVCDAAVSRARRFQKVCRAGACGGRASEMDGLGRDRFPVRGGGLRRLFRGRHRDTDAGLAGVDWPGEYSRDERA